MKPPLIAGPSETKINQHVERPNKGSSPKSSKILSSRKHTKRSAQTALISSSYERGWPSYFITIRRRKNVGVRGVQMCVKKLAANSSVCAVRLCTIFPL